MKKRIIVFSIPILILLLMTVSPLLTLTRGKQIILETIPVDPTDIFRGDYITLNYDISQIEEKNLSKDLKDYFSPEEDYYQSIKVYVTLKEGKSGYSEVKNISFEKPKYDIYLKGVLNRYRQYEESPNFDGKYDEDYEENYIYVYNIDYNIDKYFVPENSGKDFEKAAEIGNILAVVRVFRGNAMVKEIKIK